jgi:glycosyltransferase involved in cell wall biosynthesis
MKRVAIVTTHPVQYHSHWFGAISRQPGIDLEVLYCHRLTDREQAAAGFRVAFAWNVPLLDGYRYRFLENVARRPGLDHVSGIDTPELRELIPQYDAVVVNGWHYKSAWQAIIACWRRRIPVFGRGDSHLLTPRPLLKRLVKEPVYRAFISRFSGCLAAGKWSVEYFRHYGAAADRVFFVPHCVDEKRFEIGPEEGRADREQWRRSLSIPGDAIVFLFSGKILSGKRPFDFIQAICAAAKVNPRIAGLMLGDGPLLPECLSAIATSHAPVFLAGFVNQSELPHAYKAADAMVFPSEAETWGVVVNEAMLSGLPCFVSDGVGAGPDLIRAGETGEIFPVGDVETLTSILVKYAADPGRMSAMGAQARQLLSGYSTQAAVDGFRAALDRTDRAKPPLEFAATGVGARR